MTPQTGKQLRWIRESHIPAPALEPASSPDRALPTTRERLVAALADRPGTVAQLAQGFGLSQPTMLEHVRRAVRDGLITEVHVDEGQRHFPGERYYATAAPIIRQPDRDLLTSACRALAGEVAAALARNEGDLLAAFAMTHLAREGWSFADLWPYLQETIYRLAREEAAPVLAPTPLRPHGLAWVEDSVLNDEALQQKENLA